MSSKKRKHLGSPDATRSPPKNFLDTMHWMWLVLGVTWLYETCVLVFGTLPALMEWDADPEPPLPPLPPRHPDPVAIKYLLLFAVIIHIVVFLVYALWVRKPRAMHTWHCALGVFVYAWPTIAAWVWDSVYAEVDWPAGAGIPDGRFIIDDDAIYLRSYILWKCALMLAVIAAMVSTASVVDLVRSSFKHRRLHSVKV